VTPSSTVSVPDDDSITQVEKESLAKVVGSERISSQIAKKTGKSKADDTKNRTALLKKLRKEKPMSLLKFSDA